MSSPSGGADQVHVGHYVDPKTTLAVSSTFLGLAAVAVGLRFYARRIAKTKIWADDWLVLGALVFTCGFIGTVFYCLPNLETTSRPLVGETAILNSQLVYAAEIFYYIIQGLLKFSILGFYWRLFNSTHLRHLLPWFAVIVASWSISAIITAAIQCLPISASWDIASGRSYKCINLQAFFLGISVPHIMIDLSLIIMPIPHIWGLMIPSSQKLPILTLFLLGAFVLVASVTRLYYVINFDAATFRFYWAVDQSVLWSIIEHCFGIICISLPSMRPVFKSIYSRIRSTTSSTVQEDREDGPGAADAAGEHWAPRPRMGSVEYWRRLQFASLSTRRASEAVAIHEEGVASAEAATGDGKVQKADGDVELERGEGEKLMLGSARRASTTHGGEKSLV